MAVWRNEALTRSGTAKRTRRFAPGWPQTSRRRFARPVRCTRELSNPSRSVFLLCVCTANCYALCFERSASTGANVGADFKRYVFDFWPAVLKVDPAHAGAQHRIAMLNAWRNAIAHQTAAAPPGAPPLTLAGVQAWRGSCDGLAAWLDGIMYNELRGILGVAPW